MISNELIIYLKTSLFRHAKHNYDNIFWTMYIKFCSISQKVVLMKPIVGVILIFNLITKTSFCFLSKLFVQWKPSGSWSQGLPDEQRYTTWGVKDKCQNKPNKRYCLDYSKHHKYIYIYIHIRRFVGISIDN